MKHFVRAITIGVVGIVFIAVIIFSIFVGICATWDSIETHTEMPPNFWLETQNNRWYRFAYPGGTNTVSFQDKQMCIESAWYYYESGRYGEWKKVSYP